MPASAPRRDGLRLSPIFPSQLQLHLLDTGRQSDAMRAMQAAMHAGRFMCTDILMLVIHPVRESSIRVTGQSLILDSRPHASSVYSARVQDDNNAAPGGTRRCPR